MAVRRIVLHIERLVLAGYRREDREAIAAGLEAELVRLLSTDAGVLRLTRLAKLPPQRITVAVEHDAKPAALGRAIAVGFAGEGRR